MYLRDVWRVCLRRWYLVLGAIVLTAVGCLGLAALIPTTYQAQAYVVLVPPRSTENPDANRFLGLGGMEGSVAILERSMRSDVTAKELRNAGGPGDYEVIEDLTTSAPILLVTSEASSKASSARMLDAVLERLPLKLRDLQREVDTKPQNQIIASVVSQDEQPKANQKPRIRAIAGGAALLLAGFVMLIGLVDGLLVRRTQARSRPKAPPKRTTPPAKHPRTRPADRSADDRVGV